MKSLEQTAQTALAKLGSVPALRNNLVPREKPLSGTDIDAMRVALSRHFLICRSHRHGYVPVKDESGTVIREEYDVVGYEEHYEPRSKDVPQRLIEALLRPAEKRHVVYHLGRLAAHRRDTRGKGAFQVVVEDIVNDIGEVSEWAVVLACRELRQKSSAWFPTTGEIIRTIEINQERLNSSLDGFFNIQATTIAPPQNKSALPPKKERQSLSKSEWTPQDWDDYINEAEKMLDHARQNPLIFNQQEWHNEVSRRMAEKSKRS